MAVKIRLMRMGAKHAPMYRVVVADGRSPRDGRFIENIGIYQPRNEPSKIQIDVERARMWLARGAQPTDPVVKLLAISGIEEMATRKATEKARRTAVAARKHQ